MTLTELVIVLAIIGVVASMGVPATARWVEDQEASDFAQTLAQAFYLARTEAIRSGSNQVVFLDVGGNGDTDGNPLLDESGNSARVLILNDGRSGTPNQNCAIDAGEAFRAIAPSDEVSWGPQLAGNAKAPGDFTPVATASGSTFQTPAGAAATWVLFRPDGTPLAIDSTCNIGTIGTGGGALYLSNGRRDYAVVLQPLGGVRVHRWDAEAGAWL